MILKSEIEQVEFELQLAGYQFPQIKADIWDANWLFVSIRVASPVGKWKRTDPSLTTFEVHKLANWLRDVALNQSAISRIHFVEPNLSFEIVRREDEVCEMRLYFALEFLPPGNETKYGEEEFFLPISVRSEELRIAANQLCQELRKFPTRGNPPGEFQGCHDV